jgi:4'-phosphopantetheinyl transferase EntD
MLARLFPAQVVTAVAPAGAPEEPLHPDEAACLGAAGAARRREFALGRRCAREALARLGIEGAPVPAEPDRRPRWPDGIVGSLSHCDAVCAVAVARRGAIAGVGLDVERDGRVGDALARRIGSPAELAQLAALRERGVDARTWLFSAKESVYKGYYPLARRRLGFRDVEIAFDVEAGAFEARLVREDAPPAAGARAFRGRLACERGLVWTAVTLWDPAPAAPARG